MLKPTKADWSPKATLPAKTSDTAEVMLCVGALLAIGCVMVYSATSMFADNSRYGVDATYFITRHVINIVIGLICGAVVYRIPMAFWQRYAVWVGIIAALLLLLVYVPGVGRAVNGSRRWVNLGVMNLQVSELTKLAALIFTAWFTVTRQDYMHSWTKGFIPMAAVMVSVALLLLMQPDLGALVVIVAEIMGIMLLGGLSFGIFFWVSGILVVFVIVMIIYTPWRMLRFMAYLNPWDPEYVLGKAYQLSHSLIAFGRGELFGVGIGGSVEKLYYLPESHTDFIMAVIAEETGLIGVSFVVFLYYWLIRHAFEIGRQAIKLEKYFQGLIAQGVGVWLGAQVVINIGVASGALPTKGLTLPFVSYGGSALFSGLIAIGLLMRVAKENKILMSGGQV